MPEKKKGDLNIRIADIISIKSVDNIWKVVIKDALIVIISVILGASITYYFNIRTENNKKKEIEKSTAKVIYIDALSKVLTQYIKLSRLTEEDIFKGVLEGKQVLLSTEHDLIVFETYINNLAFFPHLVAARIIAFYGELRLINESVEILNKGVKSFDKETKTFWIEFIRSKTYSAIRKGKWVMSYFENNYDIGGIIQNKKEKERLNQLHRRIIQRDPNVEDKLTIKE